MSRKDSKVRSSECAIEVIRDGEAVIAVLENEEVFVAPGIILCHPSIGCVGGHVEIVDVGPRTAAERETREETGLLTRIVRYAGCYIVWRHEYRREGDAGRSKMVTYHVYEAELIGPLEPRLGDNVIDLLRITRVNFDELQRQFPFRMSIFRRIINDQLEGRPPLEEPYAEINAPLSEYGPPELVRRVLAHGTPPSEKRQIVEPAKP